MNKRLLLVGADLFGIEGPRPNCGADALQWTRSTADSGTDAMSSITAQDVDVVVADYRLSDMSGVALLNCVREKCPGALRLIAVAPEDREEVMRTLLGQHHFIPKPLGPDALATTIERVVALDRLLPNENLRKLAARVRTFPTLPTLYFQVMTELKTPDFSAERVGEIVAKDLAMTTRLLQVLNSGFYGLPRQITEITEAVSLLGQEAIKALIISVHVFLKADNLKPLYFSINQVWQHSLAVAKSARQIALAETRDPELAQDAYAVGLLHDIGKLVLANNFEELYNEAQRQSRSLGKPLWLAETEVFGVSHAELGAFLLGRWGMPIGLLEAAALHHQPSQSSSRQFTALTAVHVANALEQESLSGTDRAPTSALDMDYLTNLGIADRIDVWKECLRTGTLPPLPEARPTPLKPNREIVAPGPGSPSPPLVRPAENKPARQSGRSQHRSRWAAIGTAAMVMMALGWFCAQRWRSDAPIRVRASETRSADQASSSPDSYAPVRAGTNASEPTTSLPGSWALNPGDRTNQVDGVLATRPALPPWQRRDQVSAWEQQPNDWPLNPFPFFDDPPWVEGSTNFSPADLMHR